MAVSVLTNGAAVAAGFAFGADLAFAAVALAAVRLTVRRTGFAARVLAAALGVFFFACFVLGLAIEYPLPHHGRDPQRRWSLHPTIRPARRPRPHAGAPREPGRRAVRRSTSAPTSSSVTVPYATGDTVARGANVATKMNHR